MRSSGRTKRKRAARFLFGNNPERRAELKMNISHAAASRTRSEESRAFFPERVSHATESAERSDLQAPSLAWVRPLRTRLLDGDTNLGKNETWVLVKLLEHVDPDGRTWVSIEKIAKGARLSTQTVRAALQTLAKKGWLRINSQTWTSLNKEQAVLGRKTARRGDTGQAPNLYVVLDGCGNPGCEATRPGLVRATPSNPSPENSTGSPSQISQGSPSQKQEGEPLSKLIGDQDPSEDCSMKGSGESAPRIKPDTHISSKSPKKGEEQSNAWDALVEAHSDKTKSVYGLPPLPPDLKRTDKQALAESLDGAAAEVRAKVRQRTGVDREITEMRRELAERVMSLYFKRDNEHLRRVKHALRDLPREFHARLTEAMQAILRESHDVAPPRRAQTVDQPERVMSEDKPAPNPHKKQLEAPNQPIESVDKPRKDLSMSTALEARRLLEALNTSPQQELFRPSRTSAEKPKRAQIESERAQANADKPSQDKPERKTFEDQPSPRFERPLGRTGAPRWGAIGPRPTKMRRAIKPTPDDAEPKEEHQGGSTLPK